MLNSQIANSMTTLINKERAKGGPLSSTLQNITQDLEEVMDENSHISVDFSVTKSTIAKLNA